MKRRMPYLMLELSETAQSITSACFATYRCKKTFQSYIRDLELKGNDSHNSSPLLELDRVNRQLRSADRPISLFARRWFSFHRNVSA